MKREFWYERKVIVETDNQYQPVSYTHGSSIGYNEKDIEELTIIPDVEFKTLEKEVDENQRRIIKEETGRTILSIDKVKKLETETSETKPFKRKFKKYD